MYSLLICGALALVVGAGGVLAGLWTWPWGIVLALVTLVASWILVIRRIGRRLHAGLDAVRKQAEVGQLALAIQSLEDLRPLSRWVPRLEPQLDAQIGILSYHQGNEEEAVRRLTAAGPSLGDGQLVLAAIHRRKGETARALAVLTAAAPRNRRHALLHNFLAWLLQKEGRTEEAMAALNRYLRKEPAHEISKDNLLRLQNDQRVDLTGFGETWFALRVERPRAGMGEVRTARKGFRQPPKKRGRKKR